MKEQNMMKHLGIEYKGVKGSAQTSKEESGEQQAIANVYPGGWGYSVFPQGHFGPMPFLPQHVANSASSTWQPSFLP